MYYKLEVKQVKSNIIKYIFFAIVAVLVVYSVYIIYNKDKNKDTNNVQETKVADTNIIKEIRIPIVELDTLNPILSKNKNVQDISKLIYEPLVTLNENYKAEPCIAKEWSIVDETSYLIKIRDDVKWQDDIPLKTNDIAFTIDKLKTNNSIYSYNVQNIVGVEVIDDYTIRLNLDRQVPFFEYNLIFPILAEHYYVDENFISSENNNKPVGTGMYQITENENGVITLSKNKKWWNIDSKNARIEKITINTYSAMGEVYNAFKIGNLDLITTNNLNIEEYVGTIGFNTKDYKGREFDYIAMNTQNPLLSRTEIRRAINYSLDKTNIASSISNSKYYVSEFPTDFGCWLYNVEKVTSGYNPEQAKKVLIDNGWAFKNKYWQKVENYKTQRVNLNLVVNESNTMRVQAAELIKNQLEQVGIKINIISVSDSQYQSYLKNKNYDMIITGTYTSSSPDVSYYFGDNNLSNFNNEEAKGIISELGNIKDEKLLTEKYNRLIEIYQTEIPFICLYYNRNTIAYSTSLVGTINPNTYNIFYNIEDWYRQ